MSGEQIIQRSTFYRGRGLYSEAISCIEKNIKRIDEQLQATAWKEAKYAAEELGDVGMSANFEAKANSCSRQSGDCGSTPVGLS